jgi:hypothetical protein
MNEENTKYLFAKFPDLYRQHSLPMTQTAMCWGFSHGDGWFNIIRELSIKLSHYARKNNLKIEASQVKEKFGGLRFYLDYNDKVTDKLVEEAEKACSKTCEVCGSTNNVTTSGKCWVITRCEECRKKDQDDSKK